MNGEQITAFLQEHWYITSAIIGAAILIPRKYEALVDQWAETYGLDPLLVDAFIRTESGFDPQATSTVDARGLMQMSANCMMTAARQLICPGMLLRSALVS